MVFCVLVAQGIETAETYHFHLPQLHLLNEQPAFFESHVLEQGGQGVLATVEAVEHQLEELEPS